MNLFLQKAWLYLKKYWYIIALFIVGVLIAAISSSKSKMILEMAQAAIDSFNKEKTELEKLEAEKETKKKEEEQRLQTAMACIEEEAEQLNVVVTKEHKERVKDLVKQYSNDKGVFARKFEEEFGIKYVGK